MPTDVLLWLGFSVFLMIMLALDLGVFHKNSHVVEFKEAMIWSGVWIGLALLFNVGIFYYFGKVKGLEFMTGYLIEKSLSIDNVFIIALIFTYFNVPRQYQHRVLFWGVIGALIMRAVLIAVGATLIKEFAWIIYIFGAFLIFTGLKMYFQKNEGINPDKNPVVRFFKRFIPMTDEYNKEKFFLIREGKRFATPLFVVLLLVETTDLIFAVDSIPAIFAITSDPFIVFTSNAFAILGLRSLYFALAGVIYKFYYLKAGLSVILVFVGIKMMLIDIYKIPIGVSLGFVALVILIAVLASIRKNKQLEQAKALEK
ncbi:MAG: TerC family protein [Ignavibacteria bacterium]|jgi:tellurite resistance protein TerC|nr:TerC family protein [Ignavibacteria bacterium]MBK6876479.1 TerC family protein [Ignavibacteria bacterium]